MRLEELEGRRVLVPLSGGADSVHVLWKVLGFTRCEVIAHHVASFVSLAGKPEWHHANIRRAHAQMEAAERCAAWLKANVRSFKFTTSRLDRHWVLMSGVEDATIYSPFVSLAALTEEFGPDDAILFGWNAGDGIPDPIPEAHLRAAYLDHETERRGVPAVSWLEPYTKGQRAAELPKALANLTSSCRNPYDTLGGGWVPCTLCYTCRDLAPHLPERYGEAAHPLKRLTEGLGRYAETLATAAETGAEFERRIADLQS